MALEIYLIRHQQLFSRLLSGHLPICFLHLVEPFCSFSSVLIPVILFEPICLILKTVHLFDRYPIDSSVNNGGSSSFRQLLINSLQRWAHALLNTKAHTQTCTLRPLLNDRAELYDYGLSLYDLCIWNLLTAFSLSWLLWKHPNAAIVLCMGSICKLAKHFSL